MAEPHSHVSHEAVAKRLRRAHGHLQNVITMLSQDRACLDVAQQLHAVERAVSAAKKQLIHDHIDFCLDNSLGAAASSSRRVLDEFKAITKYL